MKVILFDIDDTLIKNSVAHGNSFVKTFKKVYNIKTKIYLPNLGMVDKEIIIESLKQKGLSEEDILKKIDKCIKVMGKEYKKILKKTNSDITLLSGSEKLLKELYNKKIPLGVLTGNIKKIGKTKLKNIGIKKYFNLGFFGGKHNNRILLMKYAKEKIQKKFKINSKDIIHVGDSLADVKSTKVHNMTSIGVATGRNSTQELKEAGANYVFKDLSNTQELLKIMLD